MNIKINSDAVHTKQVKLIHTSLVPTRSLWKHRQKYTQNCKQSGCIHCFNQIPPGPNGKAIILLALSPTSISVFKPGMYFSTKLYQQLTTFHPIPPTHYPTTTERERQMYWILSYIKATELHMLKGFYLYLSIPLSQYISGGRNQLLFIRSLTQYISGGRSLLLFNISLSHIPPLMDSKEILDTQ